MMHDAEGLMNNKVCRCRGYWEMIGHHPGCSDAGSDQYLHIFYVA